MSAAEMHIKSWWARGENIKVFITHLLVVWSRLLNFEKKLATYIHIYIHFFFSKKEAFTVYFSVIKHAGSG